MKFMNDYDLDYAHRRFDAAETTNRLAVTRVVERLAQWANANSDGWAYWPAPCRAARSAISLIESTTNQANDLQEERDATPSVVRRAVSPLKGFCTRAIAAGIMTPDQRDWILSPLHVLEDVAR